MKPVEISFDLEFERRSESSFLRLEKSAGRTNGACRFSTNGDGRGERGRKEGGSVDSATLQEFEAEKLAIFDGWNWVYSTSGETGITATLTSSHTRVMRFTLRVSISL